MAKNMARIADGIVVNIEWCSDRQEQSGILIDIADRPVGIGDTYDGTDFFRNGEKVLTPLEEAHMQYQALLAAAEAAYTEGVNSI